MLRRHITRQEAPARPKTAAFAAAFVRAATLRNDVAEIQTRQELAASYAAARATARNGALLLTVHYPTGRSARGVPRGTMRVATLGGSPIVLHMHATREALEDLRDRTYAGAWCVWHEAKPKQTAPAVEEA